MKILTSRNSEMDTIVDCLVNGVIERLGLATAKRHICNRTLVLALTRLLELLESGSSLCSRLLRYPNDTTNDVAHGSTTVASEDFHSNDVRRLGDTVLARRNCAGAVCTVTVGVLINIILRNGSTPARTTLELNMVDVDTGVDDVNVNTLATMGIVFILFERAEGQFGPVRYPCETLYGELVRMASRQ